MDLVINDTRMDSKKDGSSVFIVTASGKFTDFNTTKYRSIDIEIPYEKYVELGKMIGKKVDIPVQIPYSSYTYKSDY